MFKKIDEKSNVIAKAYLDGPRKSWFYGVISLPPVIALYVQTTKLSNEIWTEIIMGIILFLFIALMSMIAFENKKWRSVPISMLISMGLGICIVGTLASLTENTPDQVLNSTLLFMALFGLYGFCSSILGVMIHKSFEGKKI